LLLAEEAAELQREKKRAKKKAKKANKENAKLEEEGAGDDEGDGEDGGGSSQPTPMETSPASGSGSQLSQPTSAASILPFAALPPPGLLANVVPLDSVLRLVFHNPVLRKRWSNPFTNGKCTSCDVVIPFRHLEGRCACLFAKCGKPDDALQLLKRRDAESNGTSTQNPNSNGAAHDLLSELQGGSTAGWSPPLRMVPNNEGRDPRGSTGGSARAWQKSIKQAAPEPAPLAPKKRTAAAKPAPFVEQDMDDDEKECMFCLDSGLDATDLKVCKMRCPCKAYWHMLCMQNWEDCDLAKIDPVTKLTKCPYCDQDMKNVNWGKLSLTIDTKCETRNMHNTSYQK
jgi:hypothetical protein